MEMLHSTTSQHTLYILALNLPLVVEDTNPGSLLPIFLVHKNKKNKKFKIVNMKANEARSDGAATFINGIIQNTKILLSKFVCPYIPSFLLQ